MIELFKSQTTNDNGASKKFQGGAKASTFVAYGTWSSGTLKLQMSPNGGATWIDVTGVSLAANGHKDIPPLGLGILVRGVLSGATSPNLNARIF